MTDIQLTYSQRDPEDILAELQQQISVINPAWTSFLNSDVGYTLLKSAVAIGDFSAVFTDAQATETFLSLCQLRESAVRRAKELGYNPYQATPATVSVQITFPSFNTEIDIPANTTWSINGIPFTCTDPIILPAGNTSLNISLTQGTFYTATVTSPGTPWYKITIPVNAALVQVKVNNVLWDSTDTWIGVTNPQTYKTYEDTTGRTISFGANINTAIPPSGSTITITAILTQGAEGNIDTSGTNAIPTSVIRDNAGNQINNVITGVTLTPALGGIDIEPISSIQANAPALYGTQGRAVTIADWQAIVSNIPGVKAVSAVGGENVGKYSYVILTLYGTDPYNVDPDLFTTVEGILAPLTIVGISPILQAPTVIELTMVVTLLVQQDSYADAQVARNLVNTAISSFISNLGIGKPMYNSVLLATIQNVGGIVAADVSFTVDSFATSTAGKILIPIIANSDVTHCTLKQANGDVLFSGDGTAYIESGSFTFTEAQDFPDQNCTLTYGASTTDIDLEIPQVLVLTDLTINASLA